MNQLTKEQIRGILVSLFLLIFSAALVVGQNRENKEAGLKALDDHYGFLNTNLETPLSVDELCHK